MNIFTWLYGKLYGSKAKTAFEGKIDGAVSGALLANPALTADGVIALLEPKLDSYVAGVTSKFPGAAGVILTMLLNSQFEAAVKSAYAKHAPKASAILGNGIGDGLKDGLGS
ncbi:hypothetical protein CCAX7_54300 [Capsulimonas corticalis]|uniref:Uncharacterized protein n=1 Tax=Capsulimonas corticalis TaxID=2219043 RepID=A0A402CNI8_9BACT|nr:hypothetical protein [Capsulimonas corticalis]BDI33379.1 hypothetical protein CCAX7_54300 [Capsulimonas corticalis]